ncbi:hypothetical protein FHS29_000542 [Saccharothrix tamanrassetensis]|uniref:Uncharacterized protein n=1 Tax=Saccharothrix tamanrassetensis TaxID=1051531 RepID=A0A841C604_9PSEU|nr:hypothetical protein [Saccharothrix tamanrassetensis]MBB5953972.1 hypothetical protein [Saccharothrix tamanrassetensis]
MQLDRLPFRIGAVAVPGWGRQNTTVLFGANGLSRSEQVATAVRRAGQRGAEPRAAVVIFGRTGMW